MQLMKIFLFCLPTVWAQVLSPMDGYVSTPGGSAAFLCSPRTPGPDRSRVNWLVNGTQVGDLNINNITTYFDENFGIGSLTFENIPLEYNGTTVTCVVDSLRLSSHLLVQGLLSDVVSLEGTLLPDSTVSLSWEPPFSLDITAVDPDIEGYCVDVINTTSSLILHSQCGINKNEYNYSLPIGAACEDNIYLVTAVNVVGNGTQATIPIINARESIIPDPVLVSWSDISANAIRLLMSAPVCNVTVTVLDLDDGNVLAVESGHFTINNNEIIFTNVLRAKHRHYNIVISASNLAGSADSYFILSTHGVVNFTATGYKNNRFILEAVYSDHYTSSGVLFSFVFITDSGDVDFSRIFLLALDRNTSHNHTLPFDLYPGHYIVYVYDIEHDGTLLNGVGYPAATKELINNLTNSFWCVAYQSMGFLHHFNCTVNSVYGFIWAECTHPNSSFAAGIQVIVQSINVSEVHKLYVNQSMDLHTPVTVSVERDGEYLVSIFSVREGMGMLGSGEGYSQLVMVTPLIVSTTAAQKNYIFTTPGSELSTHGCEEARIITIGVGSALGVMSLIAVIMTGITTVLCYRLSSMQNYKKAQIPLDAIPESNTTIPTGMSTQQLYEEIRDVDPSPPNIVAPESTPGTPAAPMRM